MASKAAMVNGSEQPQKRQSPKFVENAIGTWNEFSRFLSDVRGEMRKVVTPSRKEVQATTTVVIIAVFIFGLYFALVDAVFAFGMNKLMLKLGGLQ
jgi:preprotein translocase subunit SecE